MANEDRPAGNGSAAGPGYYIVGDFLSMRELDAYEDRKGQTHIPLEVKVLVGDASVVVRYQDAGKAGAIVGGAKRGQPVTLRVYPRVVIPKADASKSFLALDGYVPRA